ncbi:uncharacterized protein BYT42DRAFT_584516 [Radiomyces spectabilis]|uniref:uncharacterized protein n=1 Tax=Radiomyces spectabilis TaxID=64574 RepID=UPI002220C44B|nr:uncharacterized protein BYT42DRAFT_584516 [Radiomyces spectabilis]KAI8369448.1 hypothetical protein BYT42DRAFT_584516 [Radiomyces spectabilis]
MFSTARRNDMPCEGCRERKKKCDRTQPCKRCQRLNIRCFYAQPTKPPDLDYQEILDNHHLQMQILDLENTMSLLKEDMKSMEKRISSTTSMPTGIPTTEHQAYNDNNESPSWRLTITKNSNGMMRLDTNIHSYMDLLRYLHRCVYPSPIANPSSTPGGVPTVLSFRLPWRFLRCGSFKATLRCITHKEETSSVNSMAIRTDTETTLRLIDAYFRCQFYRLVSLHKRTFYTLFVDSFDPNASPVVCGLCAAVLTMRCRHTLSIVPYQHQMRVAEFYFARTRSLVASRFDETSLEIMLSYVMMATYSANMLRPVEARTYLDMAVRLKHILEDAVISEEELETFKRSHWGMLDVVMFLEFVENKRGMPVPQLQHLRRLTHITDVAKQKLFARRSPRYYIPTRQNDESIKTHRAILKDVYATQLHRNMQRYLHTVRSADVDVLPLSLLLSTEKSLKDCYYKTVPEELRLPHSIFEEGLPESEFWRRLESCKNCDMASIHMMIRYQQCLISLYEPFLPYLSHQDLKNRPPFSFLQEGIDDDPLHATPPISPLSTPVHSRSATPKSPGEETQPSMIGIRAQEICHRSAIFIVRLWEYQVMKIDQCRIVLPCLLSAWDIHLRNAFASPIGPETNGVVSPSMIETAREYALRCVNVLQKGYLYNSAEHNLWEYYERIANELRNASGDTPPHMPSYWTPAPSADCDC